MHIISESTKINFHYDYSVVWFHWCSPEEAEGSGGITQSPKLTIFLAQIHWLPQTHFLTTYTDNAALVTSTKQTRKKGSLKTLNKEKP